jgi:hypothetical protein
VGGHKYSHPLGLYPSRPNYKFGTECARGATPTAAAQESWDTLSYSTQSSTISTSFVKSVFIFSPAINNWVLARATLDTGSTYNWISKHFLEKRLGRSTRTLPQEHSHACVAFSGHVVVPLGFVKLVWYDAEGPGCTTHEAQLLVCDQKESLFDVIIGSRTIVQENLLSFEIATVWHNQKTQVVMRPVIGAGRPTRVRTRGRQV